VWRQEDLPPSVSRGPNLVGFVNTLRARLIAGHTAQHLSFGGAMVCGVEICRHTLDMEWAAKFVVVVNMYKANNLHFSLAPPQALAWQFMAEKQNSPSSVHVPPDTEECTSPCSTNPWLVAQPLARLYCLAQCNTCRDYL
jgi:hypothetical protein